jgi:hypothetical protein
MRLSARTLPSASAFPRFAAGQLLHHPFRGLHSVHICYGLQTCQVAKATLYTRGFSSFVTSTTAPIATGWSEQFPGGTFTRCEPAPFHGARECWDSEHGLYGDTPAKKSWSGEANILAVMLDVAPHGQQQSVLHRVLEAKEHESTTVDGKTVPPMSGPSYYFRFYLHRALDHAGMGDVYISQLQPYVGSRPTCKTLPSGAKSCT